MKKILDSFKYFKEKNYRALQFCMLIKAHEIDKNCNQKTIPVAGAFGSIMSESSQ